MRYQDFIVESTREAADEFFRYARAVPADRLNWQPEGSGRSVLDISKEIAMSPRWSMTALKNEPMPEFTEEAMAEFEQMTAGWDTVEKIEAVTRQNLDAFYAAVQELPDERLDETYTLPFDGGKVITQRENIDYPRWNMSYHQGQIAYIQTLYGDKSMYWK